MGIRMRGKYCGVDTTESTEIELTGDVERVVRGALEAVRLFVTTYEDDQDLRGVKRSDLHLINSLLGEEPLEDSPFHTGKRRGEAMKPRKPKEQLGHPLRHHPYYCSCDACNSKPEAKAEIEEMDVQFLNSEVGNKLNEVIRRVNVLITGRRK